jgi:methionyl aminopeptidase
MVPYPLTPQKKVPSHIRKPPYALNGRIPYSPLQQQIRIHDDASADQMRDAARLARRMLDLACSLAEPGVTTDQIDTAVHQAIIEADAYPSPLNYDGFPKSFCSSINEVICHGIPDTRPLQFGDIVSFDVSCFLNGVHGDNCATVIVGDRQETDEIGVDWQGVPYRTQFENDLDEGYFVESRRLVQATRESVAAAISTCRPGSCLTEVGAAIHDVADSYGYGTVEKYRGHGICSEFHCAPFVKHFRNDEYLRLQPGMIFTIEPMLTQGSEESRDWDDDWTVITVDGGLAAQFEHTVLITETGVEILTTLE